MMCSTISRLFAPALVIAACAPVPTPGGGAGQANASPTWPEVLSLRSRRDYFTLRQRLETATDTSTDAARFANAVVQHAFNRPAASNTSIQALLIRARLPDSVANTLRIMEADNDRRLYRYADGLSVVEQILAHPNGVDSATLDDVRNSEKVLRALRDVPAQTVEFSGPTVVSLEQSRLPVLINNSPRNYVFDTGANISTIMRSEAKALGLRILPAGIEVGTSTDKRITADLGVADGLTIGNAHFANVIFLVLDDNLLTFPGGFTIPGIIGFPVIEQFGEFELDKVGTLKIPQNPPHRAGRNLALDDLTPLTQVKWEGQTLLCRFDTGAGRTQMYEPFYRHFKARIDAASTSSVRRMGGAGGIRETPVRVFRKPLFALGDTSIVMDSVDVLPGSIRSNDADNYLDCNIGHDILDSFSGFVLNFRDMAFVLQ